MPVVIPFVHTGMQEIMPIGASIPRIGKMVRTFDPFPKLFHQHIGSQ